MKVNNLNELLVHELKDLYDAEHQLVAALPKLAEAANNAKLAEAFRNHLEQTEEHVTRLAAVFRECGEEPDRETCKAMKGLIDEADRIRKLDTDDPDVLDAALISAAQRVEHYEIAAYGTLKVWAATAGLDGAVQLLSQTLLEEKAADEKLTEIAESGVNREAEGREDAEPVTTTVRHRSSNASRARKPARSPRPTKAR
jgi:ferritin-like metal-binding protein YciE